MRLTKLTNMSSNKNGFSDRPSHDWADWRRIYRQLLSEDRIWDFRDAFVGVCTFYGTENALDAFLGYPSPIQGLLLDWQSDLHDESTDLALLDLLSFITLATDHASTSPEDGHRQLTETCLHLAEPIGNLLLDKSPHTIHSRPFVQWVVAKSVVGSGIEKFEYLASHRGHAVFPEFEPGIMPYYVPACRENPGWLPPDLIPIARQSLQMALGTSREIHDYRTEARCLQELALGTRDPSRPLQELAELQTSKQHDMGGYLATCLTRYLTCGDTEMKSTLLKDIESFGSWEDPSDLVNPARAAARDVLRRALSVNSADGSVQSIEAALKYYPYLPTSFQRSIDDNAPRDPPAIHGEEDQATPFCADERSGGNNNGSEREQNAEQEKDPSVSKGKEGYAPQPRRDIPSEQTPASPGKGKGLDMTSNDSASKAKKYFDYSSNPKDNPESMSNTTADRRGSI